MIDVNYKILYNLGLLFKIFKVIEAKFNYSEIEGSFLNFSKRKINNLGKLIKLIAPTIFYESRFQADKI